jgi:hypothetical protein
MEVALAIVAFIALCAALMLWDHYKPSRFRTTYSTVDKCKTSGDASAGSGWFDSDGSEGGGDGGD